MSREPGLFVAFEGIDGCGKSTTLQSLAADFRRSGQRITVTHEPTDGPIGKRIYDILYGRQPMIPPLDLQRLYIEDRREHIAAVIEPALDRDDLVFCDRYWLSTIAYGMLSAEADTFIAMHREILGEHFLKPEVTLLFDLPATSAMERLGGRSGDLDFFEKVEKQERIRENYLALVKRADVGRVETINGAVQRDGVLQAAAEIIGREIGPPPGRPSRDGNERPAR